MSERVTALLVKAVQQLPPPERDELLAELIGSALGRPAAVDEVAAVVMPTLLAGDRHGWRMQQPLGTRDSLGTAGPGAEDAALKVLPVRLPVTDYDRLRTFSREH